MLRSRWKWGVLIAIAVAINVMYWNDPWLWRNYVGFLSSGSKTEPELLTPDEPVAGQAGAAALSVASDAKRVLSQATLDAMHDYAAEFGSHALITLHQGVIQDEWYAPHWSAEQLTQSQSMHKSLIGVLMGIAIEDGVVGSVRDPVGRYVDEWSNDARGGITLEQMLLMQSGLEQYDFTINPFDDGIRWLNSGRSREAILRAQMTDQGPSSGFDYNNLNTEILGMVLERAYGLRYSTILSQKLWEPMGGSGARVHVDRPGGRAFTSCCLAAPAMDWARLGQLLLDGGRAGDAQVIPEAWIQQMVARREGSPHYGYQTWLGYNDPVLPEGGAGSTGAVASEPFAARDTYLTWGRGQQHVWVIPSLQLVIVRLGPALGQAPIEPGFDVTRIPNLAMRDILGPDPPL